MKSNLLNRRQLLKGLLALPAAPVAITALAEVPKPKLVTDPVLLSKYVDGMPDDLDALPANISELAGKTLHLFGVRWLVTGIELSLEPRGFPMVDGQTLAKPETHMNMSMIMARDETLYMRA